MKFIKILGSAWEISVRSYKDDPLLEDCDGYCDWTTRTIVVEREIEGGNLADMDAYVRKVIRHEIVHAFLFECGLGHGSHKWKSWTGSPEWARRSTRRGKTPTRWI